MFNKKTVISILLGSTILGGAGYSVYALNPQRLMNNYIEDKNYSKVVDVYNKKIINSTYEEYYNDKIYHIINDLVNSFENNDSSYEEVIKDLECFTNIHNKNIMNISKDHIEYMSVEGNGKLLLDESKKYLYNEEFVSVFECLNKIDKDFSLYDDVTSLYSECVNEVMVYTYNSSTEDEYLYSIELLEQCFALTSDEVFLQQKNNVEYAYNVFKEVNMIIDNVKALYSNNDFISVFDALNKGLVLYPDNSLLLNCQKHYQDLYVSDIAGKCEEYVSNKEYDIALDIVSEANSIYPCDRFEEIIKDIKRKKNPFYSIGEFFGSLFK